jgi:hypothetical protein
MLRAVVEGLDRPVVVHCCADRPPVRLLAGAGVAGVGVDATLPVFQGETAKPAALDALGEVWDAGTPLLLGVVPALEPAGQVTWREPAKRIFELADRLGFDRARLPSLAVPTPSCGLAGATPAWARRALALSREVGQALLDPPEDI